jgi:glycerol-3-phosphate dehydrogenase
MAAQTVDEVLRHFPVEERVRYAVSRTLEPLNPLVSEALLERARRENADWGDLPAHLTQRLADRHGLEGERILSRARRELPPLEDAAEWLWCAEALHAVESTMCLHLTDFFLRRSPLVLARRDHGWPYVHAIAEVMGARLGWSVPRRQDEINALQKRLAWDLSAVI